MTPVTATSMWPSHEESTNGFLVAEGTGEGEAIEARMRAILIQNRRYRITSRYSVRVTSNERRIRSGWCRKGSGIYVREEKILSGWKTSNPKTPPIFDY